MEQQQKNDLYFKLFNEQYNSEMKNILIRSIYTMKK